MKTIWFIILTIFTISIQTAYAKVSIDIQIKGIDDGPLESVTQRLQKAQSTLPKNPSTMAVKNLHHQNPGHIQKALEPFGYFKASVRSYWYQRGEKYRLFYYIRPGPVVHITSINIQFKGPARNLKQLWEYRNKLPLKVGDPLVLEKYNLMKKKFLHDARNEGYVDAKWEIARINVDRNRLTADITLTLETGSRYYFGHVTFKKTPIGEPLLRRVIPFKYGEPFSAEKLLKLQDDLTTLNYFDQVNVQATPETSPTHFVPVHVDLTMKNRQAYAIGLGYGTDTGVRGTIGADIRYINARGDHAEVQANISSVKSEAYAAYIIPGKNPLTDEYAVIGSVFQRNTQSADGEAIQLSGAYIFKKNDWRRQYAISDIYSRNVDDLDTGNIVTYSNVFYPSVDWHLLRTTSNLEAPMGYRFNYRMLGAIEGVLSSLSFVQAQSDAKYIFPLFTKNRVLLRGSLGYNSSKSFKMPVALRLFAGGTETLRGYGFESIPNQGVGRYMYTGTVEYQQRITGPWFLAGFYDFGDVSVDLPTVYKQDAGLAIVRTTSIGTIEVGAAKAFGSDNKPLRFVLSVGPDL